jgi:GNAT superfamily N-acetyltransferase
MPDLIIRPVEDKDIAFVVRGNMAVDEKSYEGGLSPNPLTAERIRKEILCDNPRAFIRIAEHEGEQAGFVIFCFCYYASEGEGIWVTNVYVDPFCRRGGIARSLYEGLKQEFSQVSGIYGSVARRNRLASDFMLGIGAKCYEDYPMYGFENDGSWTKKT